MNSNEIKIGLGGSCHWCTEAIFQSLLGVSKVEQGWISATEANAFSEAVLVTFSEAEISLATLIQIHLLTHSCTSQHSMREKYRSAIYCFSETQKEEALQILNSLQHQFDSKIITKVLGFYDFKLNIDEQLNYYYTNPDKPFCTNVINPKLRILLNQFDKNIDKGKLKINRDETSEA